MNVLLIVLDSVRAANCSLYGYRWDTTPELDALAAESTVYDGARAPSNWTVPSHVSTFTGLPTHVHGVTIHDRLDPGHTVFERLAASGYDTGLFTRNGFLASHEVGIHEAFETVETADDGFDGGSRGDGFDDAERLLAWVDDREEPWAACLNLMDAHRPFEPRDEHDRWSDAAARTLQSELDARWETQFHGGDVPYWKLAALEALYDGGIRQADAIVGHVREALSGRGLLDETLIIVCADHGDGFGEPGFLPGEPPAVSHIVPMHESLLHVPLLVRFPDGGARRVHEPATTTRFPDVVEAAVAGRQASFVPDGPVVATKQTVTADLKGRFEAACAEPEPFFEPSRAVYDAVDGTTRKTYHWGDEHGSLLVHGPNAVRAAPAEASPDEPAEEVGRAFGTFDEADVRSRRSGDVDEGTKERLRALGYY